MLAGVPSTQQQLSCSTKVVRAFDKLEKAVVKCHRRKAKARYDEVVLGLPDAFDDAACEAGAAAQFDAAIARLGSRSCAGNTVLVTAGADRDALIAALDAQSGGPYCDATSATAIEPGGMAGFVPASAGARGARTR